MKRRRILLILFGCVAAMTLAVLVLREREPEYKGISLSEWLERYNDNKPEAKEAIQHIGTNALPYLLRWVQYETPAWKGTLLGLYSKSPSSIQKVALFRWLITDRGDSRANLAVEAFSALGPKAKPASDQLLRLALAEEPKATLVQRRATYCLMNMSQSLRPGDFDDGSRIR